MLKVFLFSFWVDENSIGIMWVISEVQRVVTWQVNGI